MNDTWCNGGKRQILHRRFVGALRGFTTATSPPIRDIETRREPESERRAITLRMLREGDNTVRGVDAIRQSKGWSLSDQATSSDLDPSRSIPKKR